MITNKDTNEFYIGKKSLYSHRTLPPLKGYKRKRKVIKESKWEKITLLQTNQYKGGQMFTKKS